MAEILNDLTINGNICYVSNSANGNDEKGDTERYPKTVTHNSDRNGKVTDTRNGIFQQKSLSNRTLLVVVSKMDPRIDYRIETIGGASHTLLLPETKEFIADAERSSVRVNLNHRHVRRTGRDSITPGDTCLDISKPAHSPVLFGSTTISPACGFSGRL